MFHDIYTTKYQVPSGSKTSQHGTTRFSHFVQVGHCISHLNLHPKNWSKVFQQQNLHPNFEKKKHSDQIHLIVSQITRKRFLENLDPRIILRSFWKKNTDTCQNVAKEAKALECQSCCLLLVVVELGGDSIVMAAIYINSCTFIGVYRPKRSIMADILIYGGSSLLPNQNLHKMQDKTAPWFYMFLIIHRTFLHFL